MSGATAGGSGCSLGAESRGERSGHELGILQETPEGRELARGERGQWRSRIAVVVSQQAQAGLEPGDAQAATQRLAEWRNRALQLPRLVLALLEPCLADAGGGVWRRLASAAMA